MLGQLAHGSANLTANILESAILEREKARSQSLHRHSGGQEGISPKMEQASWNSLK